MSPKGIATVVLPNRPTDDEAGGSGAAGQWNGQRQGNIGLRALPAETRYEISESMICSHHHIVCNILCHQENLRCHQENLYVTKRIYHVVEKPAIYPPTSWIWGVPRRVSDYDIIENLLYTHLYHGFGGVPRRVSDYDIVPTV